MTRIVGDHLYAAPCCRAVYATPTYGSINYMAFEYWSDGRQVHSLAPTDEGLRRCKRCGAYFLLRNAIDIGAKANEKSTCAESVADEELSSILSLNVIPKAVEISVRRRYWRYLNDPYREVYRQHREIANNADEVGSLEQVGVPVGVGRPPQVSRFSVPLYNPTFVQTENMTQLSQLLEEQREQARVDLYELSELYRGLASFGKSLELIKGLDSDAGGPVSGARLSIDEGFRGPFRFRW